jgi:hypothetical protein
MLLEWLALSRASARAVLPSRQPVLVHARTDVANARVEGHPPSQLSPPTSPALLCPLLKRLPLQRSLHVDAAFVWVALFSLLPSRDTRTIAPAVSCGLLLLRPLFLAIVSHTCALARIRVLTYLSLLVTVFAEVALCWPGSGTACRLRYGLGSADMHLPLAGAMCVWSLCAGATETLLLLRPRAAESVGQRNVGIASLAFVGLVFITSVWMTVVASRGWIPLAVFAVFTIAALVLRTVVPYTVLSATASVCDLHYVRTVSSCF